MKIATMKGRGGIHHSNLQQNVYISHFVNNVYKIQKSKLIVLTSMDTFWGLCPYPECMTVYTLTPFRKLSRNLTPSFWKRHDVIRDVLRLNRKTLYLPHSLVQDRIPSSFTNNQVGPLNNDDWYEKCSMAREFQSFSIAIRLLGSKEIDNELTLSSRMISTFQFDHRLLSFSIPLYDNLSIWSTV